MPEGNLYDFILKRKGTFKLQTLVRVAIDVSLGMEYLHQNDIVHRDLKTANLLMGEGVREPSLCIYMVHRYLECVFWVVKVADFYVCIFAHFLKTIYHRYGLPMCWVIGGT